MKRIVLLPSFIIVMAVLLQASACTVSG